jgi:7-cyano-7-deazaguanine reductase
MSSQPEERVKNNIKTPNTVKINVLKTIDYKYNKVRDIDITIQQPEFTSVCPMTGLPDFGCITIRYIPNNKIVELKSLKFYMLQYRNVGIFYEHVVNNILNDLVEVLNPEWMEVAGNFTARGGITTKVAVEYNGGNGNTLAL